MEETEEISDNGPIPKADDITNSVGMSCALCGCSTPAVRCDRCSSQIFCLSCDDMYHRHPKRKLHLRKAVDSIWSSARSPRLRRRTDLPGDPSKIPIPPPRSKKRERHTIGGRLFLKPTHELGSFGHSKIDIKNIPKPSSDVFAGLKTPTSVEGTYENDGDFQTRNVENIIKSEEIYENENVPINQGENVDNSNPMSRSPWNLQRTNISSPIQVSIPSSSPDLISNGQPFGYPTKQSRSIADLTGAPPAGFGHHPYHLPHYPYMHPSVHPPYSHSLAHLNCAQCLSSSWSNLMSPHPSPYFHPMPWGSAQGSLARMPPPPSTNGQMKHSHGDLPSYPDPNFHYPYPGGHYYANGVPAIDPAFVRDLHQHTLDASTVKKNLSGSRQALNTEDIETATDTAIETVMDTDERNPDSGSVNQDPDEDPPVPEKPTEPWSCVHCTFINPPGDYICQVCCKTSYPSKHPKVRPTDIRNSESPAELVNLDAPSNFLKHKEPQKVEDSMEADNLENVENIHENIPQTPEPYMMLTTETQTSTSMKSTDVQTQNLTCQTVASSTDSIFPKQEISVQTENEPIIKNCSVATDPMISSQSMESLMSGVSAPPYHNRRAGWGRGTSFSTQSLYERGRSRSPLPRSLSSHEAHSFGRDSSLPPEEIMHSWSQAWLMSDPMYYKPHNLPGFGQTLVKEDYFDGTWGSMDKLNRRVKNKQANKGESRPRFHRSLDDLKAEKNQDLFHSRELQFLQTVKEAERCGFSLEDLHVAYLHCGKEDPVFWLEDNWSSMVKNVIALAAKYGEDNEENDVGVISASEAKDALHIHRGDIWDAVTECIENRQRKILELTVRGNFTQKQIAEALKNNNGNVELAYADLLRASTRRHKFILSPGMSEDSEDIALYTTEDSTVEHVRASPLRTAKLDLLTETKADKKKSDFLTKLSSIRQAQSERRKAREEKEMIREGIAQEPQDHLEIDISSPLLVEDKSMKIALSPQISDAKPLPGDIEEEIVDAEMESDLHPRDEEKKDGIDDSIPVNYDTNWVESQGEWIEEYSDEQWDEEGDGQWVSLQKKYVKMEKELEEEAREMAALWEKEELEDEVFEEESKDVLHQTIDSEAERLKAENDEKFQQWVKINLEKSLSDPEDAEASELVISTDLVTDGVLSKSMEFDADLIRDSPLQHYPTEYDLSSKLEDPDWIDIDPRMDKTITELVSEDVQKAQEPLIHESKDKDANAVDQEYSEGEWEKIDFEAELLELEEEMNTSKLSKEFNPEVSLSKLKLEEERREEAEFLKEELLAKMESEFEAVPTAESTSLSSDTIRKGKLILNPKDKSPDLAIKDKPSDVSQPRPPLRRKSKLSASGIEDLLNTLDDSVPPALPMKKNKSSELKDIYAVPDKHKTKGEAEDSAILLQKSPKIAKKLTTEEKNVDVSLPIKPPRLNLSPTRKPDSNEADSNKLSVHRSKDGSPATSVSNESDSNCFADSESDAEIRTIRQKYMHRKPAKYENEEDDMFEDTISALKQEDPSKAVSKHPVDLQAGTLQSMLREEFDFGPELPTPIGLRGSRMTESEIASPKAFREGTARPLQLFKASPAVSFEAEEKDVSIATSEQDKVHQEIKNDTALPLLEPRIKSLAFEPEANLEKSVYSDAKLAPLEMTDTYYYNTAADLNQMSQQVAAGSTNISDVQYYNTIAPELVTKSNEIQAAEFYQQTAELPPEQTNTILQESVPQEPTQMSKPDPLQDELAFIEMESASAADYFFGRYNEVTITKPKKKTPVVKATKPTANVGPKMSSSQISVTSSDTSPSQMTVSASPIGFTAAASPCIASSNLVLEPIPEAGIPPEKRPSPEIKPVSIPKPSPEPTPEESLSFAEDYFFGSYNKVVVPKKVMIKPISVIPRPKSFDKPKEVEKHSLNAFVPDTISDVQPEPEIEPVNSDNTQKALSHSTPSGSLESIDESFYDAYSFNGDEFILASGSSQPIENIQIDTYRDDRKLDSKTRSVHFEEPQPVIVPPPRRNRQKPESNKSSVSSYASIADDYSYHQYGGSQFVDLDKKKLQPCSEDFKMNQGCDPSDFPYNSLSLPSEKQESGASSEISLYAKDSSNLVESCPENYSFYKETARKSSDDFEFLEIPSNSSFAIVSADSGVPEISSTSPDDTSARYIDQNYQEPSHIKSRREIVKEETNLNLSESPVVAGNENIERAVCAYESKELKENINPEIKSEFPIDKTGVDLSMYELLPQSDEKVSQDHEDTDSIQIDTDFDDELHLVEETQNLINEFCDSNFLESFEITSNEMQNLSGKNNQDLSYDSEQEWKMNEERNNSLNANFIDNKLYSSERNVNQNIVQETNSFIIDTCVPVIPEPEISASIPGILTAASELSNIDEVNKTAEGVKTVTETALGVGTLTETAVDVETLTETAIGVGSLTTISVGAETIIESAGPSISCEFSNEKDSESNVKPLSVLCQAAASTFEAIALSLQNISFTSEEDVSLEFKEESMSESLDALNDQSDDSLVTSTHSSISTQIAALSDMKIQDLEEEISLDENTTEVSSMDELITDGIPLPIEDAGKDCEAPKTELEHICSSEVATHSQSFDEREPVECQITNLKITYPVLYNEQAIEHEHEIGEENVIAEDIDLSNSKNTSLSKSDAWHLKTEEYEKGDDFIETSTQPVLNENICTEKVGTAEETSISRSLSPKGLVILSDSIRNENYEKSVVDQSSTSKECTNLHEDSICETEESSAKISVTDNSNLEENNEEPYGSLMSHFYDEWIENVKTTATLTTLQVDVKRFYTTFSGSSGESSGNISENEDAHEPDSTKPYPPVLHIKDEYMHETIEDVLENRMLVHESYTNALEPVLLLGVDGKEISQPKVADELTEKICKESGKSIDLEETVDHLNQEQSNQTVTQMPCTEVEVSDVSTNNVLKDFHLQGQKISTSKSCQTDDSFEEDLFFDSFDDGLTDPTILYFPLTKSFSIEPIKIEIGVQCCLVDTEIVALSHDSLLVDTKKIGDDTIDISHDLEEALVEDSFGEPLEYIPGQAVDDLMPFTNSTSKDSENSSEATGDSDSDLFLEPHSSHEELTDGRRNSKVRCQFLFAEVDSDTGFSSGSEYGVQVSKTFDAEDSSKRSEHTIHASSTISKTSKTQSVELSSVHQIGQKTVVASSDEAHDVENCSKLSHSKQAKKDLFSNQEIPLKRADKNVHSEKSHNLPEDILERAVTPIAIKRTPSIEDLEFIVIKGDLEEQAIAITTYEESVRTPTVEYFYGPLPQNVSKALPDTNNELFIEAVELQESGAQKNILEEEGISDEFENFADTILPYLEADDEVLNDSVSEYFAVPDAISKSSESFQVNKGSALDVISCTDSSDMFNSVLTEQKREISSDITSINWSSMISNTSQTISKVIEDPDLELFSDPISSLPQDYDELTHSASECFAMADTADTMPLEPQSRKEKEECDSAKNVVKSLSSLCASSSAFPKISEVSDSISSYIDKVKLSESVSEYFASLDADVVHPEFPSKESTKNIKIELSPDITLPTSVLDQQKNQSEPLNIVQQPVLKMPTEQYSESDLQLSKALEGDPVHMQLVSENKLNEITQKKNIVDNMLTSVLSSHKESLESCDILDHNEYVYSESKSGILPSESERSNSTFEGFQESIESIQVTSENKVVQDSSFNKTEQSAEISSANNETLPETDIFQTSDTNIPPVPSDIVRYLYYDDSITFEDSEECKNLTDSIPLSNTAETSIFHSLHEDIAVEPEICLDAQKELSDLSERKEQIQPELKDSNQNLPSTKLDSTSADSLSGPQSAATSVSSLEQFESMRSDLELHEQWFDIDVSKSNVLSQDEFESIQESEPFTETKTTTKEDSDFPIIPEMIVDKEVKLPHVESDEVTDISTHFTMTDDDSDKFSDIESDSSLNCLDEEGVFPLDMSCNENLGVLMGVEAQDLNGNYSCEKSNSLQRVGNIFGHQSKTCDELKAVSSVPIADNAYELPDLPKETRTDDISIQSKDVISENCGQLLGLPSSELNKTTLDQFNVDIAGKSKSMSDNFGDPLQVVPPGETTNFPENISHEIDKVELENVITNKSLINFEVESIHKLDEHEKQESLFKEPIFETSMASTVSFASLNSSRTNIFDQISQAEDTDHWLDAANDNIPEIENLEPHKVSLYMHDNNFSTETKNQIKVQKLSDADEGVLKVTKEELEPYVPKAMHSGESEMIIPVDTVSSTSILDERVHVQYDTINLVKRDNLVIVSDTVLEDSNAQDREISISKPVMTASDVYSQDTSLHIYETKETETDAFPKSVDTMPSVVDEAECSFNFGSSTSTLASEQEVCSQVTVDSSAEEIKMNSIPVKKNSESDFVSISTADSLLVSKTDVTSENIVSNQTEELFKGITVETVYEKVQVFDSKVEEDGTEITMKSIEPLESCMLSSNDQECKELQVLNNIKFQEQEINLNFDQDTSEVGESVSKDELTDVSYRSLSDDSDNWFEEESDDMDDFIPRQGDLVISVIKSAEEKISSDQLDDTSVAIKELPIFMQEQTREHLEENGHIINNLALNVAVSSTCLFERSLSEEVISQLENKNEQLVSQDITCKNNLTEILEILSNKQEDTFVTFKESPNQREGDENAGLLDASTLNVNEPTEISINLEGNLIAKNEITGYAEKMDKQVHEIQVSTGVFIENDINDSSKFTSANSAFQQSGMDAHLGSQAESSNFYSLSDDTLNISTDDDFTDVPSQMTLNEASDMWSDAESISMDIDDIEQPLLSTEKDKTPTRDYICDFKFSSEDVDNKITSESTTQSYEDKSSVLMIDNAQLVQEIKHESMSEECVPGILSKLESVSVESKTNISSDYKSNNISTPNMQIELIQTNTNDAHLIKNECESLSDTSIQLKTGSGLSFRRMTNVSSDHENSNMDSTDRQVEMSQVSQIMEETYNLQECKTSQHFASSNIETAVTSNGDSYFVSPDQKNAVEREIKESTFVSTIDDKIDEMDTKSEDPTDESTASFNTITDECEKWSDSDTTSPLDDHIPLIENETVPLQETTSISSTTQTVDESKVENKLLDMNNMEADFSKTCLMNLPRPKESIQTDFHSIQCLDDQFPTEHIATESLLQKIPSTVLVENVSTEHQVETVSPEISDGKTNVDNLSGEIHFIDSVSIVASGYSLKMTAIESEETQDVKSSTENQVSCDVLERMKVSSESVIDSTSNKNVQKSFDSQIGNEVEIDRNLNKIDMSEQSTDSLHAKVSIQDTASIQITKAVTHSERELTCDKVEYSEISSDSVFETISKDDYSEQLSDFEVESYEELEKDDQEKKPEPVRDDTPEPMLLVDGKKLSLSMADIIESSDLIPECDITAESQLLEHFADIKSLSEQLALVETFPTFDSDTAVPKTHETTDTSVSLERTENSEYWLETETHYSISEFEDEAVSLSDIEKPASSLTGPIEASPISEDKRNVFKTASQKSADNTTDISVSFHTDTDYSDQASDTCADISLQGATTENSDKWSDIEGDVAVEDICGKRLLLEPDCESLNVALDIALQVESGSSKLLQSVDSNKKCLDFVQDLDLKISSDVIKMNSEVLVSPILDDIEEVKEPIRSSSIEVEAIPDKKLLPDVPGFPSKSPTTFPENKKNLSECTVAPWATSILSDEEFTNVTPLDVTTGDSDKWSELSDDTSIEEILDDSKSFSLKTDDTSLLYTAPAESISVTASSKDKNHDVTNAFNLGTVMKHGDSPLVSDSSIKTDQCSIQSVSTDLKAQQFKNEDRTIPQSYSEDVKNITELISISDAASTVSTKDVLPLQIGESLSEEDVYEDDNLEDNMYLEDAEELDPSFDEHEMEYEDEEYPDVSEPFIINDDELVYPLQYEDWIEESFDLKEYGIEAVFSESETDVHELFIHEEDEDIQRAIDFNISNFEGTIDEKTLNTDSFKTLSYNPSQSKTSEKEHDSWSTADADSIEDDLSEHDKVLSKIDELLAEDFTYQGDYYRDDDYNIDVEDHEREGFTTPFNSEVVDKFETQEQIHDSSAVHSIPHQDALLEVIPEISNEDSILLEECHESKHLETFESATFSDDLSKTVDGTVTKSKRDISKEVTISTEKTGSELLTKSEELTSKIEAKEGSFEASSRGKPSVLAKVNSKSVESDEGTVAKSTRDVSKEVAISAEKTASQLLTKSEEPTSKVEAQEGSFEVSSRDKPNVPAKVDSKSVDGTVAKNERDVSKEVKISTEKTASELSTKSEEPTFKVETKEGSFEASSKGKPSVPAKVDNKPVESHEGTVAKSKRDVSKEVAISAEKTASELSTKSEESTSKVEVKEGSFEVSSIDKPNVPAKDDSKSVDGTVAKSERDVSKEVKTSTEKTASELSTKSEEPTFKVEAKEGSFEASSRGKPSVPAKVDFKSVESDEGTVAKSKRDVSKEVAISAERTASELLTKSEEPISKAEAKEGSFEVSSRDKPNVPAKVDSKSVDGTVAKNERDVSKEVKISTEKTASELLAKSYEPTSKVEAREGSFEASIRGKPSVPAKVDSESVEGTVAKSKSDVSKEVAISAEKTASELSTKSEESTSKVEVKEGSFEAKSKPSVPAKDDSMSFNESQVKSTIDAGKSSFKDETLSAEMMLSRSSISSAHKDIKEPTSIAEIKEGIHEVRHKKKTSLSVGDDSSKLVNATKVEATIDKIKTDASEETVSGMTSVLSSKPEERKEPTSTFEIKESCLDVRHRRKPSLPAKDDSLKLADEAHVEETVISKTGSSSEVVLSSQKSIEGLSSKTKESKGTASEDDKKEDSIEVRRRKRPSLSTNDDDSKYIDESLSTRRRRTEVDIPSKEQNQSLTLRVRKRSESQALKTEESTILQTTVPPESAKVKSDIPVLSEQQSISKSTSAAGSAKSDIPEKTKDLLPKTGKDTTSEVPSLPPKISKRKASSGSTSPYSSLSSSSESLSSESEPLKSVPLSTKETTVTSESIPDVPARKAKLKPSFSSSRKDSSDDGSSSDSRSSRRSSGSSYKESEALSRKRASIDEQMMKLQSEGKCATKERAFIAAKLIEMQFEEQDALLASRQCSSVYHAVKFLTQLCELCNCRFPINLMSSMVYCTHRACKECLKAHFTTLIYDRSIFTLLCPICQKPDITDQNIQEYFNHLDMMFRNILESNVYDLFQRKLRDEVLTKDPNFHWCSQCSSGFIASPRIKKLYCPDCSAITCSSCHQTWELEHEGVHCERFQQWKDMHTPEPPPAGSVKFLTDRGITCPSCGIVYAQASGGCMIYKCSHCSFECCGFCTKPYKRGKECGNKSCESLGIHAHHSLSCLFFLRDKDMSELQLLLEEESVTYLTIPPKDQIVKSRCQVREQKHAHGIVSEDRCGRDIVPYCAGLCRTHYYEYLAELLRKNKINPLPIMTTQDLQFMFRKCRVPVPEKVKGETNEEFYNRLTKIVSSTLT